MSHYNKDGHSFCGARIYEVDGTKPDWLELDANTGLITIQTSTASLAMTEESVTVKISLANYSSITKTDTFEVSISYPCATATLTIPSTPFTGGSININEASKTIVSAWTSDSDLFTINSHLDCGGYSFTWS